MDVHPCHRCELRFVSRNELEDHLTEAHPAPLDTDEILQAPDRDAPTTRKCPLLAAGYVLAGEPKQRDCNDSSSEINPRALELCDGIDNDCDGLLDALDDSFLQPLDFTDTKVECVDGKPIITRCPRNKLWCRDKDPIEQGCRTDATLLTSCRDCSTNCRFSCGQVGCDELTNISVGLYHACGVTREGRAACWGRGESGRLGNDSLQSSSSPVLVLGLSNVLQISVGTNHTCAIAGPDRTLFCWGSNSAGQLGTFNVEAGANSYNSTPAAVDGVESPLLDHVAQVAVGDEHSCAVLDSGALACWGQQANGRLANYSSAPGILRAPELAIASDGFEVANAAAVALGQSHSYGDHRRDRRLLGRQYVWSARRWQNVTLGRFREDDSWSHSDLCTRSRSATHLRPPGRESILLG